MIHLKYAYVHIIHECFCLTNIIYDLNLIMENSKQNCIEKTEGKHRMIEVEVDLWRNYIFSMERWEAPNPPMH